MRTRTSIRGIFYLLDSPYFLPILAICIAVALCVLLVKILEWTNRRRLLNAAQKQWPSASARVIEPSRDLMFGSATPASGITVAYTVNGNSYEAWLDVKHKPRSGEPVVIAYNPHEPRQAILRT